MTGPGGFEPPDGVSLTGKPESWPPTTCRVCMAPIQENEGYDGERDLCSWECAVYERRVGEGIDWYDDDCYRWEDR